MCGSGWDTPAATSRCAVITLPTPPPTPPPPCHTLCAALQMRYNGIQTWGCTARSAGAAVATVCVQPSVSQEGTGAMSGEMLRSFFTNTTVQVIDNRVAPDGSVAPTYTTLASPAFVGALTRYQPRVTDLSKVCHVVARGHA